MQLNDTDYEFKKKFNEHFYDPQNVMAVKKEQEYLSNKIYALNGHRIMGISKNDPRLWKGKTKPYSNIFLKDNLELD